MGMAAGVMRAPKLYRRAHAPRQMDCVSSDGSRCAAVDGCRPRNSCVRLSVLAKLPIESVATNDEFFTSHTRVAFAQNHCALDRCALHGSQRTYQIRRDTLQNFWPRWFQKRTHRL